MLGTGEVLMATDYNRDRDARARSYDPNTYVSMAIGIKKPLRL